MKQMVRVSLGDLEAQTRTLDLEILKLDRRGAHITPIEHLRATQLKKIRLAAKDRLSELRR
jgi:hypothetical protein